MLELAGKKILVVGFGPKTGVSIVRFAAARGASVRAVDNKPAEKLGPSLAAVAGIDLEVVGGGMPLTALDGVDLVVLSPGVPRGGELCAEADRRGIRIIGDIELAWQCGRCRFAGITGTDGKSTTTAMVGGILAAGNLGTVAGNIGIPVLNVVDTMAEREILALELSSFMLESIDEFRPEAAAILNLAEDHLDRYPDMESYLAAKLNIFRNLGPGTTAVWPLDNPYSAHFAAAVPEMAARVTFALDDQAATVHVRDGRIVIGATDVLAASDLPVLGRHNLRNAVAATAIAHALGIAAGTIADGLRAFRGLAHRYEDAGRVGSVRFINDSKATTISAVATAIDSARDGSCLLLGGRDKGLDFSPLAAAIRAKNLQVIPFGEAREKVCRELGLAAAGDVTLEPAVRRALAAARQAGASEVILAPGCTSYDEFANFEVRGDFFKDLVLRLAAEDAR